MKQRLGMARTLIHDPQVLVLDEPAAGLDPRARVEIRESLVELSHMGKTIFFSTHILADVAEICTRVGIIEAGKLVAAGNLEDLQSQIIPHRRIEISLLDCAQEAEMLLTGLPGVYGINTFPNNQENGGGKIRYRLIIDFSGEDLELSQVLAELVRHGIPVLCFNEDNRGLEEVFLRATKGIVT
jgi:ABC-2 type transport system ATP-binding protein